MEVLYGMVIFACGAFLYLLPSFLGSKRKDFARIAVINIFFGWSVIGWFIALIWAIGPKEKSTEIRLTNEAPAPTAVDQIYKLTQLREKGVIGQKEFEELKAKHLQG